MKALKMILADEIFRGSEYKAGVGKLFRLVSKRKMSKGPHKEPIQWMECFGDLGHRRKTYIKGYGEYKWFNIYFKKKEQQNNNSI